MFNNTEGIVHIATGIIIAYSTYSFEPAHLDYQKKKERKKKKRKRKRKSS